MNDSKFDDYARRWWKDAAKMLLLLPYHGFLVASRRSSEYIQYLRGDVPIIPYYCAIDTSRVQSAAREVFDSTPFPERDFLMIGRFVEKKNHAVMLSIYERYAAASERPRNLRLVGYGPLESSVQERISSSVTLSRLVSIEGYKTADQIPRELGKSLALLLPSKEEQFGIVATEALATGIPVIASPACGSADLIDSDVNGFVIDPDNSDGWISAMTTLGGNEMHWRRMSENTARYAQRADVSVFAQAVMTLARPTQGSAAALARHS